MNDVVKKDVLLSVEDYEKMIGLLYELVEYQKDNGSEYLRKATEALCLIKRVEGATSTIHNMDM